MRILNASAQCLVIDMQERLLPVIHDSNKLIDKVLLLLAGLKVLQVPILISEQYPKGLGPSLESIARCVEAGKILPKISFSCVDDEAILSTLVQTNRCHVIVCGVEAHVCVQQTVVDLLVQGYTPVVLADCVSSRNPEDCSAALERMRHEGAVITRVESLLFELTRYAGSQTFKSISHLVK